MTSDTTHNQTAGSRPPVVVVLGHVDHGKTTLLDAIRKTNVAGGESGGITQHIGAYQVTTHDRTLTFLDTPGHEAFTAIRSRGAKVADVAVLVVAADESVKPQTIEAIGIIKEAKLPFVVAINKVDKPGANIDKVRQDLAQHDVLLESWGGQIPSVEVAAKAGKGIPELLDMIILVADLLELKASPDIATTKGVIIESNKDPRRGYVATALVHEGTLKIGDWIVVGHVVGKVKSMDDFTGAPTQAAGPSVPVQITGWQEPPGVGVAFATAPAKKAAEEMAADSITPPPVAFDTFRGNTAAGTDGKLVLNVIFKSDVASSLEAIEMSIANITHEQVAFRVLGSGIGSVSEADVRTAAAKGAIIYAFRVPTEPAGAKLAERDSITIRSSDIIYELIAAFRKDLTALLPQQTQRTVVGALKILGVFKKDARAQVVGGRVTTGTVRKGAVVDLVRGDTPIRLGKVLNLQQEKEDVAEVATGTECGLRVDTSGFDGDIAVGDVLEFITEEQVSQSL